jgi:hypothetical protein
MREFIKYNILFILLLVSSINTCQGQTSNGSKALLQSIGNEILKGKDVSTINEKYLYQLIDSILVKDSSDREWYLKVFQKIRISISGDITQSIGFSEKEYVERFPNEAFSMPISDLMSYARDIGEIIRTEEENPSEYAKEYISKIKALLTQRNCQKFEIFSKYLFTAIEEKTK